MPDSLRVGLGTIRLGRPWPPHRPGILDDAQAEQLIGCAVGLGIRHFDTAPAYGRSEFQLGRCLGRLEAARAGVTVATKFGEAWTEEGGSRTDHSVAGVRSSVARSLDLLGTVDIIYIHKCTASLLQDRSWLHQVRRICEGAGIPTLGASVSDVASVVEGSQTPALEYLQFPGNIARPEMLELAKGLHGMKRIDLNRPLAMGADTKEQRITARLAAVKETGARALSGASSVGHLSEFVEAWRSLPAG